MKRSANRLRLAVVGQGHFAQAAILPAAARLRDVELAAIVSGDPDKRKQLGDRYGVRRRCDYDGYDALLASGAIDAVFIAVPNDLHADFAIRAARAGIHVLCEKPMAPTVEECEAMIRACDDADVKLMIAYRLHFEAANLAAVEIVNSGELGEPRIFHSVFTMQVREGNIRIQPRPGAGPLFDLGVYCVNAARYLFRDHPIEVTAATMHHHGDLRFQHVEETISAILRFPDDRCATFVASFGAVDRARYEVIGTDGALWLENAYEYTTDMKLRVRRGDKTRRRKFKKRDQIAAELAYFARCVREDLDPEPSGHEGLADVRIMLALYESARAGRAVRIEALPPTAHPGPAQEIHVPAHVAPDLVGDVRSPAAK